MELKSTHAHYIVNNYTYNETRNGWDYTLREAGFGGANCAEPVEETKLKRRKGDGTNG